MTPQPANVLLILADQQRADTIAALGNPVIRTPSLDRLAREGVAFTRAYTPSPVCVSARCSLHFAQNPARTGCYDNGFAHPQDGRATLPGVLAAGGYRTHAIGKCHFTPDLWALSGYGSRQTQEEIVGDPRKDGYLQHLRAEGFAHVTDPHGVRGEMYYVPQPAQMPPRLHPTQWIGDQAERFILGADAARPWMLKASFIHPHPPFAPPAPWHKLYRGPAMPLPHMPPESEALRLYINRHQNRYKYRDRGFDLNLLRQIKAYYYACISFIDFQVGRLLAALETTGQLDRTLVLYTADHGELLGDYGCFGKRSPHDAAARIPLLARLPGTFAAGGRCATPASLIDIAPTAARAAGIEPPESFEGVDLASLARGQARRESVVIHFQRGEHGVYSLVDPRWKYVYSAPDARGWLFDHQRDPLETRDFSRDPAAAADLARLKGALIAYLERHGQAHAVERGDWRPWPKREIPADPDAGLLIQDHPWAEQKIPGYSV